MIKGKYGDMTKLETIKAIMNDFKLMDTPDQNRALEEAFRAGFHRGEEYAREDCK